MIRHILRTTTLLCLLVTHLASSQVCGQGGAASVRGSKVGDERLAKLTEANFIATHAYQVLLVKKSGNANTGCYSPGKLSDEQLQSIVAHQSSLLKSGTEEIRTWARGGPSGFDPSKDLVPILTSGLVVPANAPVNVMNDYLRVSSKTRRDQLRSIASLYQTILEIDRDGDLLQEQFAFYIALGLPIYTGQLKLPGGDDALLKVGRELESRACASPYAADAAAWQIAGRKVWNWGEKHLHVRDEKVLAAQLLKERDVGVLLPRVRELPAQRVAVVGHSFTMGQHWSSPSSFVPVVAEIFRLENQGVEFRQFAAGGLTASRAKQRFYQGVLDWKPDKVLLVVMTRRDEDYEALRYMGKGFAAAGIKVFMFDDIHDPESVKSGTVERATKSARDAGITVIEVGAVIGSAPDRNRFVSLDRIHMTEPYHRLMAKEWLKFLAGARGERLATK